MGFLRDLFVSIFSGFLPAFIKRERKNEGISISHNKQTYIKDISVHGQMNIENNEDLQIERGVFNGQREMDS